MSDLKLCPFCRGEAYHDSVSCWDPEEEEWIPNFWHRVFCKNCGTQTKAFYTEAEAIKAWNQRFAPDTNDGSKEQTAKVMEHDASVTDTDGYKYHQSEYLCGACKKRVLGGDDYCSHCGARLDWSNNA